MVIGVPKEIMANEGRVAATPETVRKLNQMGFEVVVEKGAGTGADIPDDDYLKAGAGLIGDPERLYELADVILKVKQPLFNSTLGKHEVDMMRPGAVLIAFLHPAAPGNNAMVRRLRARRITSLTMDAIPRTLIFASPPAPWEGAFGIIALAAAGFNLVGGLVVTHRMLRLFK